MVVRSIAHGSTDYARAVDLRRRVLRWPIGLDFTVDQLAAEAESIHLAAFADDGNDLVGCLVLLPLADGVMQMRQVAVDSARQGGGVGRMLVAACEAAATARGATSIILHARATAVPFYLRLGYEVFGEPFVEVTLPHRMMRKTI